MKNVKTYVLPVLFISFMLLVAACGDNTAGEENTNGNNNNEQNNQTNNVEPDNNNNNNNDVNEDVEREDVTLKISIPLGEDYFDARFGAAADLLDHVEIEQAGHGGSVEALEELFAEDLAPDIIIADYPPIAELDIGYPLDDLIEKYGFDLDRLDQSLLSMMRMLDGEGNVAGMPDGNSFFGLYYNKDIFDTLGVDYPDPDVPMTWTELVEISKDLTREVGGVQYYGFSGGYGVALTQQGAARTDAETGEVLIEDNPAFHRYLDLVGSLHNIPGMSSIGDEESSFAGDQTVAMTIASNNYFNWGWGNPDPEEIEHIDIAPVPVWEDMPTTRPASNAWPMVIADYSEHKEEAFEFLMAYLDTDIQIDMAKTMMLQTPLSEPEVLKEYGSEVPQYEGKNIQAYFYGDAAEHLETQSQWDQYVNIGEAEERVIEENTDVNTVLRELAEEARGAIETAKGAQ